MTEEQDFTRERDGIFASIAKLGGAPYLLTQSGAVIPLTDLEDADESVIRMDDIVHALANTNRWRGMFGRYSVLEHSLLIAQRAMTLGGPLHAWFALWHDAAEAYLGDLPAPVKAEVSAAMGDTLEGVERLTRCAIGFDHVSPEDAHRANRDVHALDMRICIDEIITLAPPSLKDPRLWGLPRPFIREGRLGVTPRGLTPKTIERDFVAFAHEVLLALPSMGWGRLAYIGRRLWRNAASREPELFGGSASAAPQGGFAEPTPTPEWINPNPQNSIVLPEGYPSVPTPAPTPAPPPAPALGLSAMLERRAAQAEIDASPEG